MDGITVNRLISLIPDRMARSQSGSRFEAASSDRATLLAGFLSWLGPLSPITKEEQQRLGVRAGGGRAMVEGEGAGGDEADDLADDLADEVDDSPIRLPEAGTQIAA